MLRKFKANRLFNGSAFAPKDSVLITTAMGKILDIVPEVDAGDQIEILAGTLCPGFVNVHCHIELSHMLNMIPEHTGLVNFVQQVIQKRAALPELKQEAMRIAEAQLYNSGTVAIGDICNSADSIELKQKSKLYWKNFIEITGFVDSFAVNRMAEMEAIKKSFTSKGLPAGIVPHAPYSVSKTLFGQINDATVGEIISIHNQETAAENELYETKTGAFIQFYNLLGIDVSNFSPTGKSSIKSWLPYFTKDQRIISVHNTCTSRNDLHNLSVSQKENITFCICPNANLYIENRLPEIPVFLAEKLNIVIGTDSLASNHTLNMYEEIKTIQKYFPGIAEENILRWATFGGASALGVADQFGNFEKGKQPAVVILQHGESKRIL